MAKPPSLEKLHRENLAKFDILASEVRTHILADIERFDIIDRSLNGIAGDVKSLLQTRSFTKGAWRALVSMAVVVSTVVGLIIAWVKG